MPKFICRLLAAAGALMVILGACISDDATPTSIAALATVEVTWPTLTNTAVPPTPILTETEVAVPIIPSHTPKPTRTPWPTPTPTITPIPSPVWASDIAVLIEVEDREVVWSPTANEFLSSTCLPETDGEEPSITLERITAPDFVPYLLVEFDSFCNLFLDKIWSSDGEKIFYSGPLSNSENDYLGSDYSEVWKTTRDGLDAFSLRPGALVQWLNFLGWQNDQTIAYSGYSGGGHNLAVMLDVNTGEALAVGTIHGSFYQPSRNYVPGYDGIDLWGWVSAVVLSTDINDFGNNTLSDPNIHYLSLGQEQYQYTFNSHFEDWLPGTSQMLALTWEEGVSLWGDALYKHGSEAQLQLWDVANGNVLPLAEGGVHGRFSPNGQTLSYLTVGSLDSEEMLVDEEGRPFLYRQLMDMNQNQVSLSLPSSAEVNPNEGLIKDYDSFSPNSQLFAFFTPGRVIVGDNGYPIDVEIESVNKEVMSFL